MTEHSGQALVLIVDDEPVNVLLLTQGLRDDYRTRTATDGPSAITIARGADPPNLILLDVMMPGIDGYEVCRQLKSDAATRSIPVIFITSAMDEEAELRGLTAGAVDYIAKPINLRITRARIRSHLRQKQAQDRLAKLSEEDPLTGIANRRRFEDVLAREWRRNLREQEPLTLLMADVDLFKQFNDRYGHCAGDACLKRVAASLALVARRPGDLIARYGGEEFVALLADSTPEGALQAAETMRRSIRELAIPHDASPHGLVTISCGVATLVPAAHTLPANIIAAADHKLYAAKAAGRDAVAV